MHMLTYTSILEFTVTRTNIEMGASVISDNMADSQVNLMPQPSSFSLDPDDSIPIIYPLSQNVGHHLMVIDSFDYEFYDSHHHQQQLLRLSQARGTPPSRLSPSLTELHQQNSDPATIDENDDRNGKTNDNDINDYEIGCAFNAKTEFSVSHHHALKSTVNLHDKQFSLSMRQAGRIPAPGVGNDSLGRCCMCIYVSKLHLRVMRTLIT